jgi:xanthine dehydrogenase molybdenum-binding subunit
VSESGQETDFNGLLTQPARSGTLGDVSVTRDPAAPEKPSSASSTSPIGASFVLNGTPVEVGAHPHLLAALREELDVTSPKDGCSPSGQCGCCLVLLDGKPVVSCQVGLDRADGKDVVTLEGVDEAERNRYAAAFAATGALQCGFCTPGILLRTKALLDKHGPALTRDKAARHLGGHLCRCTGYLKILDAVQDLAVGVETAVALPRGVGQRGARYQGESLGLGTKDFVDDMRVDGMLHGAVHLSAHARADVLAIDTTAAEALPGVVRVLTAADVPGDLKVGLIHKDWPVFIPVGGRTSYVGDVLALVVAQDRATARRAAALVDVTYDVLEPFTDAAVAVASDAPAVWGLEGNVLSRSAYVRGDVEEAFATSAHVVRERFVTQRVEHAFLEPESTLAVPADGRLHLYSGGQGIWDDRNQCAAVLGIEPDRIEVTLVSNGGAFGGKEDMSNQGQTALAAWLLDRPVKTTFSREESLLVHAKRHPITNDLELACDADGVLTAMRARMLGDSGPYASVGMKVLERAAGHACGPYVVPAVDVEAVAARTNNPVCGAFRGFGANQAQFAMEGAMDRLAEQVGISGWEMRSRNVVTPGSIWGPGQRMDDGALGARACLDAVRPALAEALADGKAVGVGLALKNSGLGNGFLEISRAVVHFRADGVVEVRHCWTEMGQGIHTVALQVAVEELGIDPERVEVHVDTSRELGAGQTTGSRGTLMGAGAVADACRAAQAGGCEIGVDYLGTYTVDWTDKLEDGAPEPLIHSAFGYACQLVVADPETGEIERVVAAHDVGRAVNPLLCEGQIEGAVHMGLGYALSEELPTDADGRPTGTTLRSLGILRAKDMPAVDVILVEAPQPDSPYGIKGVGEIGLVPTAGAVAAALHQVDGRWRTRLPFHVHEPVTTPETSP